MLLEIEHHLKFTYDNFIRESHLEVRVEPRSQPGQILHDFRLTLGPNTRITRFEDWMGNAVHWFSITDYHDRIELLVQSIVDTLSDTPRTLECDDPLPTEPTPLQLYDFTILSGPLCPSENTAGSSCRSRALAASSRSANASATSATGSLSGSSTRNTSRPSTRRPRTFCGNAGGCARTSLTSRSRSSASRRFHAGT